MHNPHGPLEYTNFKRVINPELSDQALLLKCVELILSKNKITHLDDIIAESQKLFNFIKSNDN